MATFKQLSNGIVELASATMILGAFPQVSEDGGVVFCIPPKQSIEGLRLSNSQKESIQAQINEINTFSFDENMGEKELADLYKRFAYKLTRVRAVEHIYNEQLDTSKYPRDEKTIATDYNYDFAKVANAVVSKLDDAEDRKERIGQAMKYLDEQCDGWKIKGDEFRATMKKVVYRVFELVNTQQDERQK